VIYGISAWFEDRLSAQVKTSCTDFILRRGVYNNNINFLRTAIGTLFGGNSFCTRGLTACFLIALYAHLVTGPFSIRSLLFEFPEIIPKMLFTVSILSFPAALLGVSITKLTIRLLEKSDHIYTLVSLLVFDLCAKATVCFIVLLLYPIVIEAETGGFFGFIPVINKYFTVKGVALSMVIVWLLMLSAVITQKFSNVLNIEEQPLRSLGLIGASTCAFGLLIFFYIPQLLFGPNSLL
jgi:nitrate reductase NapE component